MQSVFIFLRKEATHTEPKRRFKAVWAILRPIAMLITLIRFNFKTKIYDPQGPYIVVCNHVTDWDPIFVACAFKEPMRFVSSEHIMRAGFVSKIIGWAADPIIRQKGCSAAGAVKAILRTIKNGGNVAFFPEGNRCWDGVTGDFPVSTGKLIRSSGATLVTFKLSGGYFSSPRWSGNTARKGRMTGKIMGTYSSDLLRGMSPADINALIEHDIYEDAYEQQEKEKISFKGKRLAENLETYLYICPKCGTMHKLFSSDDTFTCRACGTSARYSPTGRLLGGGFRFDNIRDWAEWQTDKMKQLIDSVPADTPIFVDSGFELYRVTSGKSAEMLGRGDLHLYRDSLELPQGIALAMNEIEGMSLRGPTDLYIGTTNGNSFLLKTAKVRNTEKYVEACRYLGARFDCAV